MNSWRLNERHYGALVGLSKDEAGSVLGEENVMKWRKSWRTAPPPMRREDMYEWGKAAHAQPMTITKSKGRENEVVIERGVQVPDTESLQNCADRILPLWRFGIAPRLFQGDTVLVVAHANSIRSLLKHIDGDVMTNAQLRKISIPSAIPLIYDFATIQVEEVNGKAPTHKMRVLGKPTKLGMRGRYLASRELLELLHFDVDTSNLPSASSFLSSTSTSFDNNHEEYRRRMEKFHGKEVVEETDRAPGQRQKESEMTEMADKEHMDMFSSRDMLEDGGLQFRSLIEHGLRTAVDYADGVDSSVPVEVRDAFPTEGEGEGEGTGGAASVSTTPLSAARHSQQQNPGPSPTNQNNPAPGKQEAIVITDSSGTILYTNEAWSKLCGFSNDEVVGRTSSILQGPDSEGETVHRLGERLSSGLPAKARVLNYRKSGAAFVNEFEILPIYDWNHGFSAKGLVKGANGNFNGVNAHVPHKHDEDGASGDKTIAKDDPKFLHRWPAETSSSEDNMVRYSGPSHFVARLDESPDLHDVKPLTDDEKRLRDSGKSDGERGTVPTQDGVDSDTDDTFRRLRRKG